MTLIHRATESSMRHGGESRAAVGAGVWEPIDGADTRAVSPERAVRFAPVFASWRVITDYISTTPVKFFRKNPDGTKTQVAPPPLIQNVDAEFGLENWLNECAYGIVSTGNAVGRTLMVDGYGTGKPTLVQWGLYWQAQRQRIYEPNWYVDGYPLPETSVVHIPWMLPNGMRIGLSPVEHFAAMVKAGLSAQEYADVRRGGGIPPSVLKNVQRTVDPDTADMMSTRASLAFGRGRPFVTGNDWDFSVPTMPANQAQFIDVMKLSATEIAAIYGIDPREVGGVPGDSMTYKTDESRALNRAQDMRPYVARIETGISKLLPLQTIMRFDTDAHRQVDQSTDAAVTNSKIAIGRLSVNEARIRDGLPPIPGGDFYAIPQAYVPPAPLPLPISKD